jgi:hypothetical protein
MRIHGSTIFKNRISQLFIIALLIGTNVVASEVEILCGDLLSKKYRNLTNKNTVEWLVWKDKNGLFLLGIDRIENGKIAESGFSSRLTAYVYRINCDTLEKEMWRIKDYAPTAVNQISYLQNTLSVKDLDSDGIAETCFLYCISGDCCDPWIVKLMLHKNYKKLAIRGVVPIHEESLGSYHVNIDTAFTKNDKRVESFALLHWDQAIEILLRNIFDDQTLKQMLKSRRSNK